MFLLYKDYFNNFTIDRFFGKPSPIKGEIEVSYKPKTCILPIFERKNVSPNPILPDSNHRLQQPAGY